MSFISERIIEGDFDDWKQQKIREESAKNQGSGTTYLHYIPQTGYNFFPEIRTHVNTAAVYSHVNSSAYTTGYSQSGSSSYSYSPGHDQTTGYRHHYNNATSHLQDSRVGWGKHRTYYGHSNSPGSKDHYQTSHYNNQQYFPAQSYYRLDKAAVNTGYNKDAWYEPYTYYVNDWQHINHAPVTPKMFEATDSTKVTGDLKIGMFAYEPNSKANVGTKGNQALVEYKVSVQCTTGKYASTNWVVLKDWSTVETYTWDTRNPMKASREPNITTSQGKYIIRLEARDNTEIPGKYSYSAFGDYKFEILHNNIPTFEIKTKDNYMSVIFGTDGVVLNDSSFKRYDTPFWTTMPEDEQDGLIVQVDARDLDNNIDMLDTKVYLTTKEGINSANYNIKLHKSDVDTTLFTGYVFIPKSELKRIADLVTTEQLFVNVEVWDEYGADSGTIKRTCSTSCGHIDCAGTFLVDFNAPIITTKVENENDWKPDKLLTIDCPDDTKLKEVVVTYPDASVYKLSPSELVAMKKALPLTQNGEYSVSAEDVFGNISVKTQTVSKIDFVKPPTPIVTYVNNSGVTTVTIDSISSGQPIGQSGIAEVVYYLNNVKQIYTAPFTANIGDVIDAYNVSGSGLSSEIHGFASIAGTDIIAIHGKPELTFDADFNSAVIVNKITNSTIEIPANAVIESSNKWGSPLNYPKALHLKKNGLLIDNTFLGATEDTDRVVVSFKASTTGETTSHIFQLLGKSMIDSDVTLLSVKKDAGKLTLNDSTYANGKQSLGNDGGMNVTLDISLTGDRKCFVYINGVMATSFVNTSAQQCKELALSFPGSNNLEGITLDNIQFYKVNDNNLSDYISCISNTYINSNVNGDTRAVISTKIDHVGKYEFEGTTKEGIKGKTFIDVTNQKPTQHTVTQEPATEWVGIDNKYIFSANSPYLIKEYQVSIDGRDWEKVTGDSYTYTRHGIHQMKSRALGNNQIFSDELITECKVDLMMPDVDFIEDIDEDAGKATITITASDKDSGFSHMILPDGSRVNTTTYETVISSNGKFVFQVFDNAGNKYTKILNYKDLVFDYSIEEFSLKGTPLYDSDFEVQLKVKNNFGKGTNIPIDIYYLDELGEKVMVNQDIINFQKGQLLYKTYKIKLDDKYGAVTLFAEINGIHLGADQVPSNNLATLDFTIEQPNYSLKVQDIGNWYKPGQYIKALVDVTGTNLGDSQVVPIVMKLDGEAIATSYLTMSKFQKTGQVQMSGFVPATIPLGVKTLTIEVNYENKGYEANAEDNIFSKEVTINMPNLGLMINDVLIENANGEYTYPANKDTYDLNMKTVIDDENIKTISVNGTMYEVGKNQTSFTMRLKKSETANVNVVLESSCKTETKSYNLRVKRLNDNVLADIQAVTPAGEAVAEYDEESAKYYLTIPTGSTTGTINVTMKDPNAKILTVGETVVNMNSYSGEIPSIGLNSEVEFVIRVSAEDSTVLKDYTIIMSNKNAAPTLKIVNKTEVDGAMYGLGGIIKDDKFTAYGDKITTVDKAKQSGRLNGIILEIDAKDNNKNQFLKGYAKLGAVTYPIRWNSFDGPTIMQSLTIEKGYVYIDRSALFEDFTNSQIQVVVNDYATSTDTDVVLSEITDSLTVSSDIKAPVIECIAQTELGIVSATATDNGTGVKSLQYRTSQDRGVTWTEYVDFSGADITISEKGMTYVEVKAEDNINNVATKLAIVDMGGTDLEVDGDTDIYMSRTRAADFIFINIDKKNSKGLQQELLDTFKP